MDKEWDLFKRLTPLAALIGSGMIMVLTIASLWITLGLPVPVWNTTILEQEKRFNRRMDEIQTFAYGTRIIVLQGELVDVQREVEEVTKRIEADPENPLPRRLRQTLIDREEALREQIQGISRRGIDR